MYFHHSKKNNNFREIMKLRKIGSRIMQRIFRLFTFQNWLCFCWRIRGHASKSSQHLTQKKVSVERKSEINYLEYTTNSVWNAKKLNIIHIISTNKGTSKDSFHFWGFRILLCVLAESHNICLTLRHDKHLNHKTFCYHRVWRTKPKMLRSKRESWLSIIHVPYHKRNLFIW